MNKKLISLFSISLLLVPITLLAANPPPPPGIFTGTVFDLVLMILNIVWAIFIGAAVIMFFVAGIMFLTAQGDPGKVATARQFLLWGVVGAAVGLLSFSVLTILRRTLGV